LQAHVHELRLGVHLQSSEDSTIDLELNDEFLALVLGVGLESSEDLLLLISRETVGRDDGDLLLLVELLVKLGVLLSYFLNEHEALVLSEDFDEADGDLVEVASLLKASIEGADLLHTNTGILSEQLEALTVSVELTEELHVFVNIVESSLLRSSCEENSSVSAWDGVFLRGGLVVGSRLDLLDITKREWLVEG
jgi:hypothetical protein